MTALPTSIQEAHLIAFDTALRNGLDALDPSLVIHTLTELVPAAALDTLLAQWAITGDGVSVIDSTESVKRGLLRDAGLLCRRRGTIWALRYIFSVAGMPEIEVVEAAGLNVARYYDGTWFYSGVVPYGFQWQWAEYAIKIYIDGSSVTISEALYASFDFILKAYAPARCKHIGYTSVAEFAETIEISESVAINVF